MTTHEEQVQKIIRLINSTAGVTKSKKTSIIESIQQLIMLNESEKEIARTTGAREAFKFYVEIGRKNDE
jgi:hypothetical protein